VRDREPARNKDVCTQHKGATPNNGRMEFPTSSEDQSSSEWRQLPTTTRFNSKYQKEATPNTGRSQFEIDYAREITE